MTGITIHKIDSRSFLQIGTEQMEISNYNVKSSADGTTELNITIIGDSSVFELSANLESQQRLTR